MRVRFNRGTALGGVGNDAHPGDVRDLPAALAATLVAAGRAQALPDEPPALLQALDAVQQAHAAMVTPAPEPATPTPPRRPRKAAASKD
jgi:hypothetical protein